VSVRSRWIDVAWALFTNLFVLSGVIAWGWPPGNVFVLFWIENVILGAVTAVRILTAEGADAPGSTDGPRWATAGFFVMHYGIFALVHGAFVAVIAIGIGLSWDWWTLGLPAVVIALRYLVDLATVWFLGGQRRSVGPGQAFASPYPRLIVLHFATLLGFAFAMPFGRTASFIGQLMAQLQRLFSGFGVTLSQGAALVALLMLLKTIADVALILRRGRPVRMRFRSGRPAEPE
jgi:hypothetical protein